MINKFIILGFELKILFYLIVLKEEQRKPICAENYPVGTLPAIGAILN